jgi:hypothetical protein
VSGSAKVLSVLRQLEHADDLIEDFAAALEKV